MPARNFSSALARAVRVHDLDGEPARLERTVRVVDALLGAAEHEHALELLARHRAARGDELLQERCLLALHDGAEVLLDGLGGLAEHGDLHACRIVQHGVHGRGDARRDGRGEEQRLALLGQCTDDAADARPEAHVEHAVGLVEHEHAHLREVDGAALHEVDEAARRGDEHVASLREARELLIEARTARDDHRMLAGLGADRLGDLLDLLGELARGGDDEGVRPIAGTLCCNRCDVGRARAATAATPPPALGFRFLGRCLSCVFRAFGGRRLHGSRRLRRDSCDSLQDREGECGGLARARLRGRHDVAACEDERDGLLLDGGWDGEAEGIHPGENLLVEPELGKCRSHGYEYAPFGLPAHQSCPNQHALCASGPLSEHKNQLVCEKTLG